MNIFTKPINEITYEGVVYFCQQGMGEGINLDYKSDFPSDLAKTISAFANTFGGIVIIGVKENDSKPIPPFEGIPYQDRLEERVWNVIVDNIYPPVFPKIKVCPPKGNKTFVIIRIPQSNEAPHAIYNNTQVYIRTGNRNKPEDLATIEQIAWLKNRRCKSEELREMLYRRAEERYQNICESKKVRIECGELTMSFAPLYPQKPLMRVEDIEIMFQKIRVTDYRDAKFPRIINQLRPVQDGMISFFVDKSNGWITYTEINSFGLIFHKEDLGGIDKKNPDLELERFTFMDDLMEILDLSFEAAGNFYNCIGYWGLIKVAFFLRKLLGIKLIIFPHRDVEKNNLESQLSWNFETSAAALNDPITRQNILLDLGREIAWSFGLKATEEEITQVMIRKFKERQRWIENKD